MGAQLLGAFATALTTRCSAAIRAWLDVCVPQSAAAAGASLGLYREPAGLEHVPAEQRAKDAEDPRLWAVRPGAAPLADGDARGARVTLKANTMQAVARALSRPPC